VAAVTVARDKVADGINPLIRPLVAVAPLNLFRGGGDLESHCCGSEDDFRGFYKQRIVY
jgi:hypothetical protein